MYKNYSNKFNLQTNTQLIITGLSFFPPEIRSQIMENLIPQDLTRLSQTDKSHYKITEDNSIWTKLANNFLKNNRPSTKLPIEVPDEITNTKEYYFNLIQIQKSINELHKEKKKLITKKEQSTDNISINPNNISITLMSFHTFDQSISYLFIETCKFFSNKKRNQKIKKINEQIDTAISFLTNDPKNGDHPKPDL